MGFKRPADRQREQAQLAKCDNPGPLGNSSAPDKQFSFLESLSLSSPTILGSSSDSEARFTKIWSNKWSSKATCGSRIHGLFLAAELDNVIGQN
jgi:hypothetical protein